MKLTLSIPDEVYERYQEQATSAMGADQLIVDAIETLSNVARRDLWIILTRAAQLELESDLGGLPVPDLERLRARITALNTVRLGKDIRLALTPAQLSEIRRRAERNHRDPEAEIRDIYRRIAADYVEAL